MPLLNQKAALCQGYEILHEVNPYYIMDFGTTSFDLPWPRRFTPVLLSQLFYFRNDNITLWLWVNKVLEWPHERKK